MLRSGAETYRVEDTMKHILNTAEQKCRGICYDDRDCCYFG